MILSYALNYLLSVQILTTTGFKPVVGSSTKHKINKIRPLFKPVLLSKEGVENLYNEYRKLIAN